MCVSVPLSVSLSLCVPLCVYQSINKCQVNKCQMSTSPSFPLFFSYPLLVILGFFYSTTEAHQSSLSLFSLSLLSSLLVSSLMSLMIPWLILSLSLSLSYSLHSYPSIKTYRLTDLGKSLLLLLLSSHITHHTSHIIDHSFSCLIT